MQIPESIRPTIDAVLAWLVGYGQPMLFGAGVVAALLALALIWRFLRTGEVHEKLGVVAVSLATLFAMEGMFEVAHGPLGLNTAGSLMFCATFEVVMLHQGSLAAHKLAAAAEGQAPDITRHMRFVWLVAVASGVIASTASNSVTEVVLRLVTPPLAAGIWYMSLYADVEPAERQPSRWIWTPQRIGVRLGLLKPGTVDDLTEVFAQRRIVALVDAGMELYVQQQAAKLGGGRPAEPARRWRRRTRDPLAEALRRLQQLTKAADADTVQAAREQLRRVLSIETELFRDDTQPTLREREIMDEARLSMRQATASLRAQVDQVRTIDGIRMPAAIADQIPDQIPADWIARHQTIPGRPQRTNLAASSAHRELPAAPRREPVAAPTAAQREPHCEPAKAAPGEPHRESITDSPRTAVAAHAPTQRRLTERLTADSSRADDRKLRTAHARLTKRLDREPSGAELAEATGVSKATANRWKSNRAKAQKES
ncbi:hypothetical protein OOK41_08925 [Micromonospora sp. NBC_01655]|uniref:hypothetical protein n=1 Tax=Micromonospora sp. NBC_01655 TaxID=2975983 RepID=UPI002255760A|nr:hypothetical protein [Micromonospora sp. NBC_01655]MCX4470427.1 hypothetical protein [Micromonospora sp. NBC_01655]